MNDATKNFVSKLKQDKEVLGIILFGSWARGNNRPGSDVDLVVLKKSGFNRAVLEFENQIFEIVYTNPKDAAIFWKDNFDDSANFWSIAKVLFDRDGIVSKLEKEARKVLSLGKKMMSSDEINHLKFDAQDTLKYISWIGKTESENARFLLDGKVNALTDVYFKIRRLAIPSPKQKFQELKKLDKSFFQLLINYENDLNLDNRISIAKKMIEIIFE